jgi:hypothetical protein
MLEAVGTLSAKSDSLAFSIVAGRAGFLFS